MRQVEQPPLGTAMIRDRQQTLFEIAVFYIDLSALNGPKPGAVMHYTLKLTQIGNSVGVILPKEVLAQLKLEKGDAVFLTESPDGYDPGFERQMSKAEEIMKRRRNVLRDLAKRRWSPGSAKPSSGPSIQHSSPSLPAIRARPPLLPESTKRHP
jgi:putative addiction module antidote